MPILSTPTFTGTEYINRPFSYVFSSDFSASPYEIQFTGSSPALLASTSGDTFFSTTGFAGTPGSAGTLSVSAVMTDPPFTVVDSSNYPVTVSSRIDVSDSAFGSNIQLYKYEPFGGNTYTAKLGGDTLSFSRSSAVVLANLSSNANVITFASATGYQSSSTSNLLVVDAISNSSIQDTVTRVVDIGAGRFITPVSNSVITLYRNEPFTPVRFTAPLAISNPVSSTSLPSGLFFFQVNSSNYDLSGLPFLQQPFSNYQIIGKGTGTNSSKIITTTVSIGVNGERLILDVSGSQDFSNLTTTTAITPTTVTARFPPYPVQFGDYMAYSWSPSLLPGFQFATKSGVVSNSSTTFFPDRNDTSCTIVLSGTPNSNTISTLVGLNTNNYSITLRGTRVFPFNAAPISSTKTFTFQFSPAVLFDEISTPTLYAGFPIPTNTVYFGARTVLSTTDVSIAGISLVGGSLPSGLSLTFSNSQARAYIIGTPNSTISPTFTLRASNTSGAFQDYTTSLNIINDTVNFDSILTPATDTCYNFIQFRPVSNAFPGRYPGSIQFKASALSGCNITMTADALAGTGLTFTSNASNTYTITGTPTVVTPLTTLTVVATEQGSGSFNVRNVKFSISSEIITIQDVSSSSFNFIQNRAITPVQFSASSLSEKPITSFTSTTLPDGLSLSTSGLLTGTPLGDTSGTMTILASTGYSSTSKAFPYSITPDSVILTTTSTSYPLVIGGAVPAIEVLGVSYSGKDVSNYQFSNLSPTYGMTIGSNTGIFGGTLTDTNPPNDILPALDTFEVKGSAGAIDSSLGFTLVTTDRVVNRSLLGVGNSNIFYSDDLSASWNLYSVANGIFGQLSSYGIRYSNICNQTLIFSGLGSGSISNLDGVTTGQVLRFSTQYGTPSIITLNSSNYYVISSVANKTSTNTWWASGGRRWSNIIPPLPPDDFFTPSNLGIFLHTSSNDGVSWTSGTLVLDQSGIALFKRTFARNVNAIDAAGSILKYKDGVLLLGGSGGYSDLSGAQPLSGPVGAIVRSTDDGNSWNRVSIFTPPSDPNFSFAANIVYDINVDDPNIWIALGRDYLSNNLQYSTDQGSTWSPVTGQFSQLGYGNIAYGSNAWLATMSNQLRFSKDGSNWSPCDLPSLDGSIVTTPRSPVYFDGSNFKVFATSTALLFPGWYLFKCSPSSDFSLNSWSYDTATFSSSTPSSNDTFTVITAPAYTVSGPNLSATLNVDAYPPGPTFTSPSSLSFVFNQYVAIPTITVSATGSGIIYYFVDANELPVGLRFDPLTATITGTPARTGTVNTRVYAKDNVGVTILTLSFTIIIPRIIRQQTSASAYTSMVRQYTLVNAAQNARGNRVLTEDGKQGEFMAPMGTDNLIPNNCFICDPNSTSNGSNA
jgi:hypothetical protein